MQRGHQLQAQHFPCYPVVKSLSEQELLVPSPGWMSTAVGSSKCTKTLRAWQVPGLTWHGSASWAAGGGRDMSRFAFKPWAEMPERAQSLRFVEFIYMFIKQNGTKGIKRCVPPASSNKAQQRPSSSTHCPRPQPPWGPAPVPGLVNGSGWEQPWGPSRSSVPIHALGAVCR